MKFVILLVSKIALNKTVIPVSLSNQFGPAMPISFLKQTKNVLPLKEKKKKCFFSNTVSTQIYSIFLKWQRKSLIYPNALSSQQVELFSTQKCS